MPAPSKNKFCDISNWQPSDAGYINAIKSWGAKAVVVKITDGSSWVDKTAEEKIKNIRNAGMKVHVYHFFKGVSAEDARGEAQHFCRIADKLGIDKQNSIMVNDVEAPSLTTNAQALTNYCNAFYDEVARLGWKRQDTYSSASWYQGRIIQSQLKANNFWCASYGAPPEKNFPSVKFNAWQFAADPQYGNAQYINGTVTDCNYDYNGFYTVDGGGGGGGSQPGESKPPAEIKPGGDITNIDEYIEMLLKDKTLKKTTLQYCLSILGYLPMNQMLFDKPPWL